MRSEFARKSSKPSELSALLSKAPEDVEFEAGDGDGLLTLLLETGCFGVSKVGMLKQVIDTVKGWHLLMSSLWMLYVLSYLTLCLCSSPSIPRLVFELGTIGGLRGSLGACEKHVDTACLAHESEQIILDMFSSDGCDSVPGVAICGFRPRTFLCVPTNLRIQMQPPLGESGLKQHIGRVS